MDDGPSGPQRRWALGVGRWMILNEDFRIHCTAPILPASISPFLLHLCPNLTLPLSFQAA
jgi:hypothetical protein